MAFTWLGSRSRLAAAAVICLLSPLVAAAFETVASDAGARMLRLAEGVYVIEHDDATDEWPHGNTGVVVVDDGGREALENKGKSLLPGGIVRIDGSFKAGDCVNCSDLKGVVFARGLTKYSSVDLELIKGLKTSQIASVLGHKDYDEVIHRDDLVIL